MRLREPRITTRATHTVSIRVDDGPIEETRPTRGRPARFQVDNLTIRYVDGKLCSVRVSGVQIRADGEPYERGTPGTVEYHPGDGGPIVASAPEWVRDAVAAHSWPTGLGWCGQEHT